MKKIFLAHAFVWVLSLLCANAQVNLANGLIAHYSFTGNANDLSGNANNFFNNGAALTTDRFGNPNSAFAFNGTTTSLSAPNPDILRTEVWSVSAWYRTTSSGTIQRLTNKGGPLTSSTNYMCIMMSPTGAIYGTIWNGAVEVQCMDTRVTNDGLWHHVVFIREGVNSRILNLYVDGILRRSVNDPYGNLVNASDFTVGRNSQPNQYWNGSIDDIRIYNRILSQEEVCAIHDRTINVPSPIFNPLPTNFCVGTSYNLTVQQIPNATYEWSLNGQPQTSTGNTFQFTPQTNQANTTIVLSVRARICNQFGPAATTNIVVPPTAAPNPTWTSALPASVCVGVPLTYAVVAMPNASTYEWIINGTTQAATGPTFTYTPVATQANSIQNISVRARGCNMVSTLANTNIFVHSLPNIPAIQSQPSLISCAGNTSQFSVVSTPNITYSWTSNGIAQTSTTNQLNLNTATSGSYLVQVRAINGNGCRSDALGFNSITANALPSTPTLISPATSLTSVCSGTTNLFSVGGTASAYQWYENDVLLGTVTTNSFNKTWLASPTTSTIKVRAVQNGCFSGFYTFPVVTTTATPTTPVISGKLTDVCEASSQVYSATGSTAATYLWKLNGTSLPQTTQSVTVTNINTGNNIIDVIAKTNNCISPIATATIVGKAKPILPIISGNATPCPLSRTEAYEISNVIAGSEYFFRANEGLSIKYATDAGVPYSKIIADFPYLLDKPYVIQATSKNECGTSIATLNVRTKTGVPQLPNISCVTPTCNQYQIQVDPVNPAIVWTNATVTGNNYVSNSNGPGQNVRVKVTANGCSYESGFNCGAISTARMDATETSESLAVSNVYPNPNNGSFTLETDGEPGTAFVYSNNGQLVKQLELVEGKYLYDLSIAVKGIYLVKLRTNSYSRSHSIVIN